MCVNQRPPLIRSVCVDGLEQLQQGPVALSAQLWEQPATSVNKEQWDQCVNRSHTSHRRAFPPAQRPRCIMGYGVPPPPTLWFCAKLTLSPLPNHGTCLLTLLSTNKPCSSGRIRPLFYLQGVSWKFQSAALCDVTQVHWHSLWDQFYCPSRTWEDLNRELKLRYKPLYEFVNCNN